jgi:predicted thioesterase
MDLKLGANATLTCTVTKDRTAASFAVNDGERYPAVLATPFLIADLERACASLLEPLLGEGQLSVGAHIDVRHMAPTGVGGSYTASATYAGAEGVLFWFDVSAEDAAGTIGKGRIARAIVNEAGILARGASGAGS